MIPMHRSAEDVKNRTITFAVAKNRHGENGIDLTLRWEGEYSRIVDPTPTRLYEGTL